MSFFFSTNSVRSDDLKKEELLKQSFIDSVFFEYDSKLIKYGKWDFDSKYKIYSDLNFLKRTDDYALYIFKGNISGNNDSYFFQSDSAILKKYNKNPLIKSIYLKYDDNQSAYAVILEGNIKIFSKERDIFYLDKLEVDHYTSTLNAKNMRGIYDDSKNYGVKFHLKEITKDVNDEIEIRNLRLSSCINYENYNWFKLKEKDFSNKCEIPDLNIGRIGKDITEDQYFSELPVNLKIDSLVSKKDSDYFVARGLSLQLFGKTAFKWPKMSIKKDLRFDDSGVMPPIPMIYAGNNYGVAIPFYINYNKKSDTIIAPEFYLHGEDLGKSQRSGETLDLQRIRENNLRISHRRLFSFGNNIPSILSVKGAITDKTGLINDETNLYERNSDGSIKYGYRGYFSAYGDISLSRSTDLRFNLFKSSDPYFGLIYRYNYVNYAENEIKLNHTTDNRHFSVSAISFTPLILNFDKNTAQSVAPMINFREDLKYDKFGGYFSIFGKSYSVTRNQGFDTSSYSGGIGYYLPNIVSKIGQRFTSESEIEFRKHDSSYTSVTSDYTKSISSYYDSYYKMLSNGFYSSSSNNYSDSNGLFRTIINTDSLMLSKFKNGNFLFRPVASFYLYKGSDSLMNQNETSYQSNISYFNLFSLNRVSGIDSFESGNGVRYGFDSIYKNNGYRLSIGAGVDNRLETSYENPLMATLNTNYNSDNLSGVLNFKSPKIINYNISYSLDYKDPSSIQRYIQGISLDFEKVKFYLQKTYINKNYTIFNYETNSILASVMIKITKRINFITFGLLNMADNNSKDNQYGSISAMNFFGAGFSYETGCLEYRLFLSKMNAISNSGTIGGYRILFRVGIKM